MRLLFFLCIYIGSTYYAPAKPNIFRPLQFLNMSFIPEQHLKYSPLPRMHPPAGTDFVEKELRSSSSMLLQSLNISQKPITLSVLKCETSSCFTDCSAQINLAEQSVFSVFYTKKRPAKQIARHRFRALQSHRSLFLVFFHGIHQIRCDIAFSVTYSIFIQTLY